MMDKQSPDDGMWFAPKRFGYGAGLPIAWQGWALTVGFVAICVALARVIKRSDLSIKVVAAAAFVTLLIAFIEIVRHKTRGGWKWRSGGRD